MNGGRRCYPPMQALILELYNRNCIIYRLLSLISLVFILDEETNMPPSALCQKR